MESRLLKMDTKLVYYQPLLDVLKEGLKRRLNDYFSFEYSINSAIIATISNPKFKLNWLSNYVEEKYMLLSTFRKYVNRHIPDNEVYITTPEQSETNSDECYVIDDNVPSTSKSTVEIEILNYINSKNTNLDMLNNYPIIKMLFCTKFNKCSYFSHSNMNRFFSILKNMGYLKSIFYNKLFTNHNNLCIVGKLI